MASEAIGVSGLAGRYAEALFELADQQKQLDPVAQDLRLLRDAIGGSPDLRRAIRSPVISRPEQGKAIEAVAVGLGLSAMTRNFVGVVARNGRAFALSDMAAAFLAQLARRRGEIEADVTAAQPLSDAQLDAVTDHLRRSVGSKVVVKVGIDPAILGGLIVKVGSRMVDGSLRTKLHRLQLAMKGS